MIRSLFAVAALAAAFVLPASGAWSKDDKTFLREAIQGNLAEIDMGRLAQRRSNNPGVKAFGKMLVDDHSAANERARSVAQQVGTTPPRRPSLKQRLSYGYYAALRGATFDRQFITHMVRDHKKDIQEFRTEAQSGTGPAADFAKETLPTLEKHLSTAQELQPKVTAERR